MPASSQVNPSLIFSLRRVTESAATAAFSWIGRGDSQDAGVAALDAMRAALAEVDIDAVVAIGEATRGEAPQPQRGERLGRPGSSFKADIAVDPVEGTSYLVRGQTNALAVLAVAPRGAMVHFGPAFYMEKFVASAPARGKIDPRWPTEKKLTVLAEALGKDVDDLTVFVLEKHGAGEGEQMVRRFEKFEQLKPGKLDATEYDAFVRDIVNFLDYVAEPVRLKRERLGIWVIGFLLVFTGFAYALKKEIWKDVQ